MTGYSPSRRTALVLTGTGAHGAYHAGVLRAMQEAGVKIDVIAGQGVGAGGAALAAIDGAARLWDAKGSGVRAACGSLYTWRGRCARGMARPGPAHDPAGPGLRPARRSAGLSRGISVRDAPDRGRPCARVRLLGLAAGRICRPEPSDLGSTLRRHRAHVRSWRPVDRRRAAGRTIGSRRAERGWWWRIMAAPFDAHGARDRFIEAVWELIRGAAPVARPSSSALGRRYAEVLSENLGQPGFRELVVVATDLDARRDVVAALLAEPYRQALPGPAARTRSPIGSAGPGRRVARARDRRRWRRPHAVDAVRSASDDVCPRQLLAR